MGLETVDNAGELERRSKQGDETASLVGLTEFVLRVRPHGAGSPDGLPASFFVEPSYWSRTGAQDAWISGTEQAFWQRLTVQYGLNLYCGACRQIALATTGSDRALAAASSHTELLLADRAGASSPLRAWSDRAGGWRYGDENVRLHSRDGSGLFFSAICDRWTLSDPLTGASHLPPEMGGGPLHWNHYDPFLGENSWAALIGPLQLLWLRDAAAPLVMDVPEIRLARSLLAACRALQSSVGGIYGRPSREGSRQERLVSNETNLTLYAGLRMLQQLLARCPDAGPTLEEVASLRSDLERYFHRHLCGRVDGELRFHACSLVEGDTLRAGISASGEAVPFAADVHTWGLGILGVRLVDSWFGHGAAYRLWNSVKRYCGYYPDGDLRAPLHGIGFSSSADGRPIHDTCSPEWTFGAINMCRVLAAEYDEHDPGLAACLRDDECSMLAGVRAYETSPATEFDSRAYLYVNRTTDTGFGWSALPLPCLSASAWAVMIHNRFNPFRLGGDYRGVDPVATPESASGE